MHMNSCNVSQPGPEILHCGSGDSLNYRSHKGKLPVNGKQTQPHTLLPTPGSVNQCEVCMHVCVNVRLCRYMKACVCVCV